MPARKRITTAQRLAVAKAANNGRLMLTLATRFNRKPIVDTKTGDSINQNAALSMLEQGLLIPAGDDGLFAGCGQTLGLSSGYKKELKAGGLI